MGKQMPIVEYRAIAEGPPRLVAWEAGGSGARYFDRRNADAKGGGTEFRRKKLATKGVVRSFTIVNRGVPGVPVPYVSVLVDLEGGGTVKANLSNITPDPDHVKLGMAVKMLTFAAGPYGDGTDAIAFAFEPAS